ncbi:ABC transporter substrate-binding protein [Endothiovibrio diazotrophicus]
MNLFKTFVDWLLALGLLFSGAAGAEEVLTIGLASEPTSIDPHFHNLTPNNALADQLFSRLVEQDERQNLIPGLATSWRAVDDTTREFRLRRGVTFHDGTPFTADDVLFTNRLI